MRMKFAFAVSVLFILSIENVMAQSYHTLWNQVEEAEKNDLPQTQRKVLSQIITKAEREAQYGQLLKALLKDGQAASNVSPDSLKPFVERLTAREQQTKDVALQAVCQAVLGHIYAENRQLDEHAEDLARDYREKAMSHPRELSVVKASDYAPLLVKGADSHYYGDDLLSAIGYETKLFAPLHQYYLTTGNRVAQLFSGIEWLQAEAERAKDTTDPASHLARLDSLIEHYADLPECGEAAIARYEYMAEETQATVRERVAYIDEAVSRWGSWKRMDVLRNNRQQLTMRMFQAQLQNRLTIPDRQQTVRLQNLRNLQSLTMKVYRVKADADLKLDPSSERDYKKLKPLLTAMPELTQTRHFEGRQDYEQFEDSMLLAGLPIGVYMLEFQSQPQTEVSRSLYFVSDVRVLSQELPRRVESATNTSKSMRYVVVNATTGQPLAGATLRLTIYQSGRYDQKKTVTLTTGKNGECLYDKGKDLVAEVYASTAADHACPADNGRGYFNYYNNDREVRQTAIYTDRAIYRPGQKVQMSAILYTVSHGFEHQVVAGKTVRASLRNANYEEVASQELVTDEYGVVNAEFMLPAKGLTGHYSINLDGQSYYFRVEEYKRPTFQVEFPEVKQDYRDGDTLTVRATALSYAGVPVQSARVSYRVERRMAWWWVSYYRYWQGGFIGQSEDAVEVLAEETMTDADGHFEVRMPMVLPKSKYPQFYNFVVVADVTDAAGETHQGQLSLPLGNRQTALTVDLSEKILMEKPDPLRFHLLNAAGNDIDSPLRYQIDGGKWMDVQSNTAIQLPKLKSGQHRLLAVCGEDSLERSFVVFSLEDKRPATETDDWFYVQADQFADASTPVTLQVGSSAQNVHIVYTIVAGDKIIEQGAVDKSNALINRKFTYKEEYGNGLTLSFAWMREGKSYTHSATIRRPLPDKQLRLKWETFRDRLVPGQQEEWTLSITSPTGGRVEEASLMATLYDKSLDQLSAHRWSLEPNVWLPLATLGWQSVSAGSIYCAGRLYPKTETVSPLYFWYFDETCFPSPIYSRFNRRNIMYKTRTLAAPAMLESAVADEEAEGEVLKAKEVGMFDAATEHDMLAEKVVVGYGGAAKGQTTEADGGAEVQVRENLQETAFFFPQLQPDSSGCVKMKFTLPESLTTWRFMGLAHTKDMMHGLLDGEAVAKKDVMIQPNVPRFIRMGDEATISARIFNTTDKAVNGKARLLLLDAESENVILDEQMTLTLEANSTNAVSFKVASQKLEGQSMLVCKMMVTGDNFSDGEQHYLPVLPSRERVTVTVPFTQTEPGTKTIDLATLIPASVLNPQFTIEYTNNPAWLMIQALPTMAHPHDNCAICQAASLYANSLGRHILSQNPRAKQVFELWKREQGDATSMMSMLQKNEELKELVLSETPWVLDANREAEQKARLSDFFDATLMDQRLSSAVEQLQQLQNADGSWSWWQGMTGSYYITVEVSEMLVRLNSMVNSQPSTLNSQLSARPAGTLARARTLNSQLSILNSQLSKAFSFMDKEIVEMVKQMKAAEKKGQKQVFPSHKTLQYLYIYALDGRKPSADVASAQTYLKNLLKKEGRSLTIYDKAMASVVLNSSTFLKSLHEWTSYKEGVGRYYDTPRAGYSWRDYRIPTQVAAIEAFKRLTPNDTKTIREMQQWLLHEKRAQAWDTPINSVEAVYAFLDGHAEVLAAQPATALKIDGQPLDTSAATAGIGYVKTVVPTTSLDQRSLAKQEHPIPTTFTAEKTSAGTSWGAVYAQFMQDTKDISDQGSELSVKREIIPLTTYSVGQRVLVRLTIEAQRDLDFVEVVDRRAACMEPVGQLSGYRNGYYCAPKDNATHYFFNQMPKGRRVIETEYYIDRAGQYETGTCTVQCAYAPEFHAVTHSQTLVIKQ